MHAQAGAGAAAEVGRQEDLGCSRVIFTLLNARGHSADGACAEV